MSPSHNEPRYAHEVVRIRVIWVAVVLSLFIHGAALWEWMPRMRPLTFEHPVPGQSNSVLVAQLAQRPSPPATTPATTAPKAVRAPPRTPALRPAPKVPASPPVLALQTPAPAIVAPPAAPPTVATPPAPAPIAGDLSAYIEARRRARADPAPSPVEGTIPNAPPTPENDTARRNRIVAANLGLSNTPTSGGDRRNSGGLFQVERLGYNDAEFMFNGWSNDIGRKAQQRIEVRKGEHSDIRFAVIRRMIAIIREHESADFIWVSPRLGRELTLSARASDNRELEAFLLKEFFAEWRPEVGAR